MRIRIGLFGPGHLIPNPEAARTYLMSELQEYREDLDKGHFRTPNITSGAQGLLECRRPCTRSFCK